MNPPPSSGTTAIHRRFYSPPLLQPLLVFACTPWSFPAAQSYERGGSGESGESNVGLAHLYGNRALVHVCLGDDVSALDDLDKAVSRDTRNIT